MEEEKECPFCGTSITIFDWDDYTVITCPECGEQLEVRNGNLFPVV